MTIAYNGYFDKTFGPADTPINVIREEVAKKYPEIQVEFNIMPYEAGPWRDNYLAWFQAEDGTTDLIGMGLYWLPEFGKTGWLMPLNDMISPEIMAKLNPAYIDAFTYNGDEEQRRWFRSAHAHSVVVVDERDYAQQAGTFAWRQPPRGVCEATSATEFCGRHDAYRDLGITLRRRIEYRAGAFVISDSVAGHGRHHLRWRFQVHPRWSAVSVQPGGFAIGAERFLEVRAPADATCAVRLGAVAPRYNHRMDAPVCEVTGEMELPVQAEFILR